MKRLLFVFIIISCFVSAHAQWHFSITSMNYDDNCSSFQAGIEVSIRMGMAETEAAKTYSSKEECESHRSAANMNYSNSGCYLRITTSPCTGGNIGGGGTGGDGLGSGFQAGSLYNSIAIGEPYFAPNEAYVVSNTGRDLEIKLEALNKSLNDAIRGIKTGDTDFDDIYNRQVNSVPKNNTEELYAFKSRPRYVKPTPIYLEEGNGFASEGDVTMPIDPERIKNQERDERWEKSQKETQHRLDSIMEKNQYKVDSIYKSQNYSNTTLVLNNKSGENEPSLESLVIETFQVGSGFIQNVDEGVRYINETFGVTIPGSEQLSNLNSTFIDLEGGIKEIRDMGIIIIDGDLPKFTEKLKAYATDAVAIAVNPYVDKVVGSVKSVANQYVNVKKGLAVVEMNKETSQVFFNRILNYAKNPNEQNLKSIERFEYKQRNKLIKKTHETILE